MMCVEASTDGLPVIVAKLEGVAAYLDNWAIIELANPTRSGCVPPQPKF